jgi:hypothetical protein
MNHTARNDDNPSNDSTPSGSNQPYHPLIQYLLSPEHQALTYYRSDREPLDVDAMIEQIKKNLVQIRTTIFTEQFLKATEGLPAHLPRELEKDLDEIKSMLRRLNASRAILVPIYEEVLSVLKNVKSVMVGLDSARDATLIKRLEEEFPEAIRALLALTDIECK